MIAGINDRIIQIKTIITSNPIEKIHTHTHTRFSLVVHCVVAAAAAAVAVA